MHAGSDHRQRLQAYYGERLEALTEVMTGLVLEEISVVA